MSFFGGEDRTYVATSVVRGIEDKFFLPSTKSGSITSVMQGGELSSLIMEDLVNGLGVKGNNYYNTGKNSYVFGLPASTVVVKTQANAAIKSVIETFEDEPITMNYGWQGPKNYNHLLFKELAEVHLLNEVDELPNLTAAKKALATPREVAYGPNAYRVFLTNAEIETSQAVLDDMPNNSFKVLGREHKLVIDDSLTTVITRMEYRWLEVKMVDRNVTNSDGSIQVVTDTTLTNRTESVDLTTYAISATTEKQLFMAMYRLVSANTTGPYKFFTYEMGTGTYPVLDSIFDVPFTSEGTCYPFTYFRYNNQPTEMGTTPESIANYKSIKKLAGRLAIPLKKTVANINENPDISKVEQAMVIMAVPADTKNELDIQYLYMYFDKFFVELNGDIIDETREEFIARFKASDVVESGISIRDKRFKMALVNDGIYRRTTTGVLGPIGTYKLEAIPFNYVTTFETRNSGTGYRWNKVACHYFMKQITTTQYEEIQVLNLAMRYKVWEDYESVGTGLQNKPTLLVPLDHTIVRTFSLLDREEIHSRSIQYIFNSKVTVHVAWYQTTFFQGLFMFVAIVMLFSANGPVAKFMADLAAASTTAAQLKIIAIAVLKIVGTQLAIKLFTKAVGEELAILTAIVLIAYSAYQGIDAGSFAKMPPDAMTYLNMGNGLIKEANASLSQELSDFTAEATAEWDKLTKLQESLESDNLLMSPWMFVGEDASAYLNRLGHSANIGINSLSALHSYVERALTLPTLYETLGDKQNG